MKQLLFIFIGGGTGSIARYLLNKLGTQTYFALPIGTIAVNVLGSFIVGLILSLALKYDNLNTNITLLLATGFCGGFTTFSTFSFESHTLLRSGEFALFGANIIISVVVGLIAVFGGVWLGERVL